MTDKLRERVKRWLGPGLCKTWRQVQLEWRLSRLHRAGLRRVNHVLAGRRPVRLELGPCGRRLPGWISIDLFCTDCDLTLDLRRPLPFPDDCVDVIYSEHVLEHFTYPDPLAGLLRECRRVLKPGGRFLASVPDAGRAYRLYAAGEETFYANKQWNNSHGHWATSPMDELNWHDRMKGKHGFMFDEVNLVDRLREAGFADVHLRDFHPTLDRAERRDNSIYVGAVKRSGAEAILPPDEPIGNSPEAWDRVWADPGASHSYANSLRWHLWREFASHLAAVSGPILDLGCGSGRLLAMLACQDGRRADDLCGVDSSSRALQETARRVPGVRTVLADVMQTGLPTGSFEAVVVSEVLELVDNPRAVLTEASRVLAPGGRLLVSVSAASDGSWRDRRYFWNRRQFAELCRPCEVTSFPDDGEHLVAAVVKNAAAGGGSLAA